MTNVDTVRHMYEVFGTELAEIFNGTALAE
jgi:hypothetical protein